MTNKEKIEEKRKIINENLLKDHRCTDLTKAIIRGDLEAVSKLIEDGTSATQESKCEAIIGSTEISPLNLAILNGQDQIAFKLIEVIGRGNVNKKDRHGYTYLHHATMHDQQEIVQKLIETGANLDIRGEYSENIFKMTKRSSSALEIAILNKNDEIASMLIDAGTDVNIYGHNRHGLTPLSLALNKNQKHRPVISKLIKATDSLTDPLYQAIRWQRDPQTISELIKNGADVNVRDKSNNYTLLHYALKGCSFDVVTQLIEAGLDINAENNDKKTYLHFACSNKQHPEIALRLIEGSLYINTKDKNGDTPLHHAILKENSPIVDQLLAAGADPNCANCEKGNQTILQIYAGSRPKNALKIMRAGGDINALNISYGTALSQDVISGHPEPICNIINLVHEFENEDIEKRSGLLQKTLNLSSLIKGNSQNLTNRLIYEICKYENPNSVSALDKIIRFNPSKKNNIRRAMPLAKEAETASMRNYINQLNSTTEPYLKKILDQLDQISDDAQVPPPQKYAGQRGLNFEGFIEQICENIYCNVRDVLLDTPMEISQIKSASKRAAINAVTLITDHKEKANNLKSAIWKSAKKVATASEVGILSADLWAIILDHVAEKDSQEIWSIDQFQIYPYELSPGIDLGQNLLNLINETSFKTIKEARIDSHTSCYNSILMAAKDNIKSRLSLFAAQDPQKFGQRLSIQQEVLAKRPEKPLDTNPFDYLDPGQINYFFRSLVTALDDPINKEIKSNLESALDSFVKIAAEKLDPEILNQIQIPQKHKDSQPMSIEEYTPKAYPPRPPSPSTEPAQGGEAKPLNNKTKYKTLPST